MASRRGIKPKRFNASSVTPLLRTDPSFEPFELANIEMILTSEMINKPWLTKALNVTVDHGKSLTTEDEAMYEHAMNSIGNRLTLDQTEKRISTLKKYFKIREGQKKLAMKRLESFSSESDGLFSTRFEGDGLFSTRFEGDGLVSTRFEGDGLVSTRSECRLAVNRLASLVVKSGCVKIELDDNDPTQFANNLLNNLLSIDLPSFAGTLSLELLSEILTMKDESIDKTKYNKKMYVLRCVFKLLNRLEVELLNALFSFKNNRGGWKTDVLGLIKSVECKRKEEGIPSVTENAVDIERVKHQVSNVKIVPEIVAADELDFQIKELKKLVSTVKCI